MFQPPVHQTTADLLPWLIASIAVAALVLMAAQTFLRKRPEPEKEEPARVQLPVSVGATLTDEEVSRARNRLNDLKAKRDMVTRTLTRLHEAGAEDKLTEEERSELVNRHNSELKMIEQEIAQSELLIDLHELEETRAGLYRMLQDKFSEFDQKIEAIQSKLGIAVEAVEPSPLEVMEPDEESAPEEDETMEEAPRKPRVKTKAEEKLDKILAEVDKELERLEQMETEV